MTAPACRILILGAPSIRTASGHLSATKPLVFGAALYIGLRRGDAVGRAQLASVLWPDAPDATRNERMRWLVYQLKESGFPVRTRPSEIFVEAADVELDIDALISATSADEALALARGDVLQGYDPTISDTFSRWLDETRDTLRSSVIRSLDNWLAVARRSGVWSNVEEIARRMLALDEFHEGAALALAEALALQGRRDTSMQVLARYRNAAGAEAGTAAVRQLRARLQDIASTEKTTGRVGTMVGRGDALARLLESVDAGRPSSRRLGVAGPAGIGKTRLLQEFATVARLRGTRIARVRCGPADALRPLSLVSDLVRTLLDVRGALGTSPQSVDVLRRFLGESEAAPDDGSPDARRAAVYAALSDLVSALTDDGSLAVIIDDAQWAEPGSWSVLAPLFAQPSTAALSWIVSLRAETRQLAVQSFRAIFLANGAASEQDLDVLWLAPLATEDVAALCRARVAPRPVTDDVLAMLIERAAGIPFIAEALVDHWQQGGDIDSLPPSVSRLVSARLDRLSPNAQCVLECVAVLGPDAELPALEAVSMLDRAGMMEGARELDTAGIMRTVDGRFAAHALWTEAVLERAPGSTLQMLHRYSAEWLEHMSAMAGSVDHRRHWSVATHWLDAGDPARARRALDRAAEMLAANGFVRDAAMMLERGADIAGVTETALHYWERAAELRLQEMSSDGNAAVMRIHAQYDEVARTVDPAYSPHHDVELMSLAAFGRMNISRDDMSRRLMPCVMDPSASALHRIAATTRILFRHAHSETDRSMADAAWDAVRRVVPSTSRERLEMEVCASQYHTRVTESHGLGVHHAEQARAALLSDATFNAQDFRRVMILLGDAYELAGDLDLAQATRREVLVRGQQTRNPALMTSALDVLIGAALEAGRHEEARSLLTLFGRPAPDVHSQMDRARVIYWVVCALEEGDAERARADLTVPLEAADEAPGAMPRARILAMYGHLALLEDDDATIARVLPGLLECLSARVPFMDHPAYVAARCLARVEGEAAARVFVRDFLANHRVERWTPRPELVGFAKGD